MSRTANSLSCRGPVAWMAQIVLVLLVAVLLAGCGKKGNPLPPPDEPNTFPRPYPKT